MAGHGQGRLAVPHRGTNISRFRCLLERPIFVLFKWQIVPFDMLAGLQDDFLQQTPAPSSPLTRPWTKPRTCSWPWPPTSDLWELRVRRKEDFPAGSNKVSNYMTLDLSLLNPSEGSGEAARKALTQVYMWRKTCGKQRQRAARSRTTHLLLVLRTRRDESDCRSSPAGPTTVHIASVNRSDVILQTLTLDYQQQTHSSEL